MCFAAAIPLITTALSTAASMVSGAMQVKAQNEAALTQYKFQQQQQQLVNQATMQNYQETVARQRLEAMRAATSSQSQAEQTILENQRRQAAAMANASTAGITGMPLQMQFNDYQVGIGNVASNLKTTYDQINQNLFFNIRDAAMDAQARMNQVAPAPPYLASFSPFPYLLAGAASGINAVAKTSVGNGGQTQNYTPASASTAPNYGYSSMSNFTGGAYRGY